MWSGARIRTVVGMTTYTEALSRIPGFEPCRRRDLDAIARDADRIDVSAGAVLIEPGDHSVGAVVVIDGEAVAHAHGWTFVLTRGARLERTAAMPADLTVRARTDMRVLVFSRRQDLRMYSLSV
jgi:hypothetical protein